METKRMKITLKNRSKGTSVSVFAQASLTHWGARWEREEDICFHLSPRQVKEIRKKLCPNRDCEVCLQKDATYATCSETSIDDERTSVWIMGDGGLNIFFPEPMGREGVIRILMRRNGMSREDAENECRVFAENLRYMIEQAYPIWQIEQEFTSYFGVEPDYMIDFI